MWDGWEGGGFWYFGCFVQTGCGGCLGIWGSGRCVVLRGKVAGMETIKNPAILERGGAVCAYGTQDLEHV